jgi:hypothetical protein
VVFYGSFASTTRSQWGRMQSLSSCNGTSSDRWYFRGKPHRFCGTAFRSRSMTVFSIVKQRLRIPIGLHQCPRVSSLYLANCSTDIVQDNKKWGIDILVDLKSDLVDSIIIIVCTNSRNIILLLFQNWSLSFLMRKLKIVLNNCRCFCRSLLCRPMHGGWDGNHKST